MFCRGIVYCVAATVLALCGSRAAQAQGETPRPYDGIQAGTDAYRLAEEQRRNQVAGQAAANDYFRERAAWRPAYGFPEDVIYYRSPASGYAYGGGYAGGLGSGSYGYSYQSMSRQGLFGSQTTRYGEQVTITPGYSTDTYRNGPYGALYRPGYVIGVYRDPGVPYLRQPIGQRQIQTGPNRWESHPVYADDPPAFRPPPTSAEQPADGPSPIVRPKIIVPPREY